MVMVLNEVGRTVAPPQAPKSWREHAVEAHARRGVSTITMRHSMQVRLELLTGRLVAPEAIYADGPSDVAVARIDGELFRLRNGVLTVERACTFCGVAPVASRSIETLSDLGYVESAWLPRCGRCTEEDPASDTSW